MSRFQNAVACLSLALLASSVHAQPVIVGGPATSSNCAPFNCAISLSISRYQLLYSSAAFTGPMSFNALTFYGDPTRLGNFGAGIFTIHLSYAASGPAGIQTVLGNNVAGPQTHFRTFSLAGSPVQSVNTFVGATFNYDPSLGNLLLDVAIAPSGVDPTMPAFLLSSASPLFSWAVDRTNGPSVVVRSYGLITGFSFVQTVVPEPSTVILLGMGIAGVLTAARRRNRIATRKLAAASPTKSDCVQA